MLTKNFVYAIILSLKAFSKLYLQIRRGDGNMNKSLKLFVVFVALACLLVACGGKSAAPTTIVGTYTVAGTNPDKSEYKGTLDVTASGEAYTWSWNGGEYKGVGLQQGNVVSVGWGGDECYVVSYLIGDDGILTGKWTDMALSGIGADVATPTENMGEGIEGLYNAVGTNPDGSEYGCSLQVTKKGDVYEWYWFSCGEYTGVGIQDGKVVSVSYGSENCSAISYHVEDDGSLNATWAYVGGTDLGTEVDKR
jgi:hypothetical protein